MFEWKLSKLKGWVFQGNYLLLHWTSSQTQIFNLRFPEPLFLLSAYIYSNAV